MQICLDMRTGAGCGAENPNYARLCRTCRKTLRFALTLLEPDTTVKGYRIVRVIGYGAYGAVYEALDESVRVALKETFASSSISTFEREFSLLSGLQHPNLPRYLQMFEADGNGYLVMEYVPGQSLQEILDGMTEPLLESQVLGYALQLCDVLAYLHSQQPPILHRDIKPANIRLTPEGRIKLVDFGLLKQGGVQTRGTIRGLGTAAYAPLEQYGDEQQVTDLRSDIYSFSATLYHLLSGQAPPPAPNRLAGDHDELAPLPMTLSSHVREAVIKAMSLMPRDRFADISQFKQALQGRAVGSDVTKKRKFSVIEKPVPEPNVASGKSTSANSQATSQPAQSSLWSSFLKRAQLAKKLAFAFLIAMLLMIWFGVASVDMNESEPIALPAPSVAVIEHTKTPTITSTASPLPPTTVAVVEHTKTPKPDNSGMRGTGDGMACFGSFGFGITCLDESGWHPFREDDSPLGHDLILDMAVCPDNRVLIAHISGVSAFDGQNWTEYDEDVWGNSTADAIACDANGGIWVAHFRGVSYFNGESFRTTPSEQLATGNDANDLVYDVAIAPDGRVWVATVHTIATTLDGNEWTVYQQGQGFNDQYYLETLVVDHQGEVWTAYGRGLLHFDGTRWTEHEDSGFISINALAVDDDGNVWVGTYSDGLKRFNGQNWATYDMQNSGLINNHVRSLAIDAQGRIWAGSDWGLSIFDGENWQSYQMDSADLVDNDIRILAVIGNGPPLPKASDKENGSLTGQFLKHNKEPIVDATVELCAPDSNSYASGGPCKEEPLVMQTTTDADGNFTITDIPVGRVVLTIRTAQGEWIELEDDDGIGEERILIKAGEETDLSILIVGEEDS